MKVLLTGGAGFIGSNLVKAFLSNPEICAVRVLDNLSTGNKRNLEAFFYNSSFEFIEGDVRDKSVCEKSAKGMDVICHQAALGSVPRSIEDPITSHQVNVDGFINILEAARENKIKKVVYASSSSVYGDINDSIKVEPHLGNVLSPYAATKRSNEIYADAYAKNYNLKLIGLRYFNVFGPKQNPNGPYAAVIPIFIQSAIEGKPPVINGDGSITRDYTPVANVVQINTAAILDTQLAPSHEVFNVACSSSTSLIDLWELIRSICGIKISPEFGPMRAGDIMASLADINKAQKLLNYHPDVDLKKALVDTVQWYKVNDSRTYFS